ncbi:AbrB/MazE/SpoVT family DNA-binding domain-containing protein [Candidatus Microgenomates bacterium]|nr:AbrB/MazE/SpoVT family DNA-binding domain-containing protein [Candidatus Microgenomates bacterium]
MQGATVKISSKYQVVIPREIRMHLNLKPKEEVCVGIDEKQKTITIKPKVKNWAKYMRGLGREAWENMDVDQYIKKERESWIRNK